MKDIERIRDEEAAGEEAAAASRAFDRYTLQAAILSDPQAAQDLLTDLIDSGHDGTLVSAQFGDSVIYEVHLGPYATLDDANRIGEAVRRSHGLAPAVLIRDEEEANE